MTSSEERPRSQTSSTLTLDRAFQAHRGDVPVGQGELNKKHILRQDRMSRLKWM